MNPAKLAMMMGGGARYVGGAFVDMPASGGISIPWPANARAGDLGILYGVQNNEMATPTVSTTGWTEIVPVQFAGRLLWKVLTPADLAATITYSSPLNKALLLVVFRGVSGANSLSNQGDASGGSDARSWSGFTKGTSCRGLVLLTMTDGNGGGALSVTSPSLPNVRNASDGAFDSNGRIEALYDLTPGDYVNGTAVVISGYTTGYSSRAFVALEIV